MKQLPSYSSSSIIRVTIRAIKISSTTITPITAPVALLLLPLLLLGSVRDLISVTIQSTHKMLCNFNKL